MNTEITEFIATQPVDIIYILIKWPFVQSFKEFDWFAKEAILYQAFEDQRDYVETYFVPIIRFYETGLPGYLTMS